MVTSNELMVEIM